MRTSWISPKTIIRKSSVNGKGLFAKLPIKVGEVIAVKGGCVYDGEVNKKVSKKFGVAAGQIDDDLFIGPLHKKM